MSCIFSNEGFTCFDKKRPYNCTACRDDGIKENYTTLQKIKSQAYGDILKTGRFDLNNKAHLKLHKYFHDNELEFLKDNDL